jgi:hypothetical protein
MVRQRRYCLIVSKGPERMKPVRMASVGIREVDERYWLVGQFEVDREAKGLGIADGLLTRARPAWSATNGRLEHVHGQALGRTVRSRKLSK